MDLRVFANRSFTVSTIVLVTSFMGLFGTLIVLPIFLQTVLQLGSSKRVCCSCRAGPSWGSCRRSSAGCSTGSDPDPRDRGAVLVSGALWLLTTLHRELPPGWSSSFTRSSA